MVENAAVQVQGAGVHRSRLGFLSGVSVLVHTHRERLLAYARRRGLDAEDALDAVQDSFISFLELPEARTTAHESVAALKLLTVILHHNVQNQRRKRSRHQRVQTSLGTESLGDEAQSSEILIVQAEELARVKGCLLRMAQLERDVVRLSLLDDQPRDHVGQVLGISAGYVRVLLHRARQHLRNCPFDESEPATGQWQDLNGHADASAAQ